MPQQQIIMPPGGALTAQQPVFYHVVHPTQIVPAPQSYDDPEDVRTGRSQAKSNTSQPRFEVSPTRAAFVNRWAEWQKRAAAPSRGVSRQVKLTDGHYVVDLPVPSAVVNSFEPRYNAAHDQSMSHMRYSAVVDGPEDFTPAKGWRLRTTATNRRSTELLIVGAPVARVAMPYLML